MTSLVCRTSGTPRRRRNTTAHLWFSARHTCSAVTCGFSPPQPLGVRGHEPQHDQRQDQVPPQPRVVPPLVVHQAGLLLPEAERLLHRRPAEGHRQHPGQRGGRGVGEEVLHLGRRLVGGHHQRVLPVCYPHRRRRRPPERRTHTPVGQPVPTPAPGVRGRQ